MKIKPISLISVLLFFGGLTLLGISLELLWLAIIFEVCALLAIVPDYFKQKKEQYCSNCKTKYDFDNDISYQEISSYSKARSTKSDSRSKQINLQFFRKLRVTCLCSNCSQTKSYVKDFVSANAYDDGTMEFLDVEDNIEQYYKKGLTLNRKGSIAFLLSVGIISILLSFFAFIALPNGLLGAFIPSHDPTPYYNTSYYAVDENYTCYTLSIYDDRVYVSAEKITGVTDSTMFLEFDSNTDIKFLSKENYHDEFEISNEPDFDYVGVLYVADESNSYIFYITDDTEGNAVFTIGMKDGSYMELTTTKVTVKDVTKDPANYYGQYRYGNDNLLELGSGYVNLTLNGQRLYGKYYYADEALMKHMGVDNVDSGIIVILDDKQTFYWFAFAGDALSLQNTYDFVITD